VHGWKRTKPVRQKPSRTLLHLPLFTDLCQVTVNDQSYPQVTGVIEL